MSYILDALKKADQQRQRAATPSLQSAPQIVPEEKKSSTWRYAAVAVVLVAAGTLIGWLQTWDSSATSDSQRVAAAPTTSSPPPVTGQPSAPQAFPVMPSIPAPPLPLPDPAPNAAPARPVPNASAASAHTARPTGDDATPVAAEPPTARVLMMDELPLSIRQSLPAMAVSLHAWSATPKSRIVSINNQILHEGDSPAAGVSLEEITPDGMIMTFRGYRFRHGVR